MILALKAHKLNQRQNGFSLLELVVVLMVFTLLATMVLRPSLGDFTYYEQEDAIQRMSEYVSFLYNQAISDGQTYGLVFDLTKTPHSYRIVEFNTIANKRSDIMFGEEDEFQSSQDNLTSAGSNRKLSNEIDNLLHPLPVDPESFTAPSNFPSLKEDIVLPEGIYIEDIRNLRGDHSPGTVNEDEPPYVAFFPNGYAEFAAIHLKLQRGEHDAWVTLLVNPFTGVADVYREYKEFEWTYSNK